MSAPRAETALRARLAAHALPSSLGLLRDAAAEQFRSQGLPSARHEAWRFTDLRALDKLDWDTPDSDAPESAELLPALIRGPLAHARRIVFVDGAFSARLSQCGELPAGVQLGPLGQALEDPHAAKLGVGTLSDPKERSLSALNTALFQDGARLSVPADTVLDRPIVVVYLTTGHKRLVSPRVWIDIGVNGGARVVEYYAASGSAGALVNGVSEARLADGAKLDHVQLQEQNDASVHFAQLVVRQDRDSRLRSHSIAIGSALARVEIRAELAGEGSHARLHGLYLGDRSQVLDHRTEIDHAAPHTTSDELYKGILGDRAKGVFCGFVAVRPHAQKIDAKQTNRALLLSDTAAVHTRPQLEIHADDVRCSHGASIGQLDADALFYLRTRGIGLDDARALLTSAFVEDVLATLPCDELSLHVRALLRRARGNT